MAFTEDRVRFAKPTRTADEMRADQNNTVEPPSALETTLRFAADQMRRNRHGGLYSIGLEKVTALAVEALVREDHQMVLGHSTDPANPTSADHRLAQYLASTTAAQIRSTIRNVLEDLKAQAPAPATNPDRDLKDCPSWCVHYGTSIDCDWHESRPIAIEGPGDFYEDPGPTEVMWAVLSETPQDAVDCGEQEGAYIFVDTLGDGCGGRLNVAQTDDLIRQLTRYTDRLKALRDQLAAQPKQAWIDAGRPELGDPR
jgi:hypothetical protein